MDQNKVYGRQYAMSSLVLGIIAILFCGFGITSIASLVCGIIGVCMAGKAKKLGFAGDIRTAGFITSLVGLIVGAVFFVLFVLGVVALGYFTFSGELLNIIQSIKI